MDKLKRLFHVRLFRVHRPRHWKRCLVIGAALALILPGAGVLALRAYSALRARGQIYSVQEVPYYRVTIIFGALIEEDGRLSDMLADRVATGADLYHAGKTDFLLMTGDNSRHSYNEPEAMRRYALQLGVPDEAIVLDYAGFRTYDSCYRARDIFQVKEAILVTQAFHLDRALLTCNALGIDAVGVAADVQRPEGYAQNDLRAGQIREFPATLIAVYDLLSHRKPTFLGEPLPIAEK
jgi:SanA protein